MSYGTAQPSTHLLPPPSIPPNPDDNNNNNNYNNNDYHYQLDDYNEEEEEQKRMKRILDIEINEVGEDGTVVGDEEFWEEWEEIMGGKGEKGEKRRWIPCSRVVGFLIWLSDFGFFQLFVLAGILSLGALFFKRIESDQELPYEQCIYWASVTVSTIGYGDVTPHTKGGKLYTILFSIFVIPYYFFVSSLFWKAFSSFASWTMTKILCLPTSIPVDDHSPSAQNLIKIAPFLLALLSFFMSIFIGASTFSLMEGWDYGEAIYFCYITQTTIGYGDKTVSTPSGRGFLIVYSFWNITTMGALISSAQSMFESRREKRKQKIKKRLNKQLKNLLARLESRSSHLSCDSPCAEIID